MNALGRSNPGPFASADLPFDSQGRIYHLQLKPEELAENILIAGDPGRVAWIADTFFDSVDIAREHRGLKTITGTVSKVSDDLTLNAPLRVSAVTSGMGTSSLEIVLQELSILNEIDFSSRSRKASFNPLNIIRVGTSGALQSDTRLGTPIITTYSIGIEHSSTFLDIPFADKICEELEEEFTELIQSTEANTRYRSKIYPIVSRSTPEVVKGLKKAAATIGLEVACGLTLSNSGFFANQGRDIARVAPVFRDFDLLAAEFRSKAVSERIENMEMEASFLNQLCFGLGYRSGAICVGISNRRDNSFAPDYQEKLHKTTAAAILALSELRSLS
ncbi:MAG: uridine phosphorylase [Candidatus Dadabacteria bacterium]|nr:MAG: uridine phosphorylase [Candidatus Dadabacteria bacterium]